MSVQTEITRLEDAKAAIVAAVEGKNVIVPEGTKLDEIASLIETIKTGGGYKIIVTVDSGAAVTATNGAVTVSGTSNGTCILEVGDVGEWTVSSTLDGAESTTRTVEVINQFYTTLVYFNAPVAVYTSAGAEVICSKDGVSFTVTAGSTGVVDFTIRDPGTWSITASKDGKVLTDTIAIDTEQLYEIYLPLDLLTLNSNTWAKISEISAEGKAANYWAVGDCKAVHLSGTMGTLALDETLYVYILGFDHNKDVEGAGVQFGGFKTSAGSSGINVCLIDGNYSGYKSDGTKTFNMNHWGNYNHGGWGRCDMRYDILGSTDVAPQTYGTSAASGEIGYDATATCATNPVENTLMSCLPADLRAVMKPIVKYTDNVGGGTDTAENVTALIDYLPLLAEFEIFGTRSYANSTEQTYQQQYAYFKAGNTKKKYRHSATGSTAYWWERSPYYNGTSYFCIANTNGTAYYSSAIISCGVAPAFLI